MSPEEEKEKDSKPPMLSAVRVLDLTDEKGALCGKILGDLGADVIKVERPSGDPARRIGPFYGNTPDPEKSLHWFAFNSSKRGITLNLEAGEGQEIFKKLSSRADVVIESFSPGHLNDPRAGLRRTECPERRAHHDIHHSVRADRASQKREGFRHHPYGNERIDVYHRGP